MFWRKKPKLVVSEEDKAWIEQNLNWIQENIVDILKQPVVLPTKRFFDRTFTKTEEDAHYLLKKIGEICDIQTDSIEMGFYSEQQIEIDSGLKTESEEKNGTAGLYIQDDDKFSILIEIGELQDPVSLMSTIAHELCHFKLMGLEGIIHDGYENELITDLLSMAYGFGVIVAYSSFRFSQFIDGNWLGWQSSAKGYLPQQCIAHILAEIEFRKGNKEVDWDKFLNDSIRLDFQNSLSYLHDNE